MRLITNNVPCAIAEAQETHPLPPRHTVTKMTEQVVYRACKMLLISFFIEDS